jgi:flagellar hook-basal body complex protein FliE
MQFGIESLAPVASAQTGAPLSDLPAAGQSLDSAQGASTPSAFAALIQTGLSDLNANIGAAETAMQDLAAGKSVELHDVMISLERARISVQTFVQVRNKLIESYQDLMRMQL